MHRAVNMVNLLMLYKQASIIFLYKLFVVSFRNVAYIASFCGLSCFMRSVEKWIWSLPHPLLWWLASLLEERHTWLKNWHAISTGLVLTPKVLVYVYFHEISFWFRVLNCWMQLYAIFMIYWPYICNRQSISGRPFSTCLGSPNFFSSHFQGVNKAIFSW